MAAHFRWAYPGLHETLKSLRQRQFLANTCPCRGAPCCYLHPHPLTIRASPALLLSLARLSLRPQPPPLLNWLCAGSDGCLALRHWAEGACPVTFPG